MPLLGPKPLRAAGRTLLIWASLLPLAASGAGRQDVVGTLPEDYFPELKTILQLARERAPRVIAAEIEITLSEARREVADAPRLPQLAADLILAGNQTAISGNQGTRSRNQGFFYNVALNQALFHWGALKNQSAIARINEEIARRNHGEAYRLLALNLRQLFLALVAKRTVVTQAQHALDLLAAGIEVEREKLSRGLVARNSLVQREIGLRETRLYLRRLEAEFAGDRRRFARLAGRSELAEGAIPEEMPRPAYSPALASILLAAMVQDGAASTFEAEVAALRMQEAELRYDIEKVRLRPRVFVSAGTGLDNATTAIADTVTQQGVTRHTVSLNAQWAIFDGFASRGARMGATAVRRQQERQLDQVTTEMLARAQQLERELALDAEALAISEEHRELAAETLRQRTAQFQLGNQPKSAVDQARSGLLAREAGSAGARAAYLSRWSELVSLAGADPVLNTFSDRHARDKR